MSQSKVDHQTARRRAVMVMFIILVLGVGALVGGLIYAAGHPPTGNNSQFIQGIILTAIAGAISAFLSFIGLIVKGIVDNLTKEDPTQ